MSERAPSSTTPPHVTAFNQRLQDLLRTVQPTEMVDLMSHPDSLLRNVAADNQNQNQGGRRV
jgi:hypothetical protein